MCFICKKYYMNLKGIVSNKYQVCHTVFFMDRKIQINKSQDNDVPVIVSFVTICILLFLGQIRKSHKFHMKMPKFHTKNWRTCNVLISKDEV